MTEAPALRYEQAPTLSLLVSQAFYVIDQKYGPESVSPKRYHNLPHTMGVVEAASDIADEAIANGKISLHATQLIIIAAAYHDIEQDLGSGLNERASADAAIAAMRKTGEFSSDDEQAVSDMIMATQHILIVRAK